MSYSILLDELNLIKNMVEQESPEISEDLKFKTPYNLPYIVPKENKIVSFLKPKIFNGYIYLNTGNFLNLKSNRILPPLNNLNAVLRHKIVALDNYEFPLDVPNNVLLPWLKIKGSIPISKLAYFNIKNCFYEFNSNLLPDKLKEISLKPIVVPVGSLKNLVQYISPFLNLINDNDYYQINPKRGLIPSHATCSWFSDVIINENPYIIGCYVDDCFCSIDYIDEAIEWFTIRGFNIHKKGMVTGDDTLVKEQIVMHILVYPFGYPYLVKNKIILMSDVAIKNMKQDQIECSICYDSFNNGTLGLACNNCMICSTCYYTMNKNKEYSDICETCENPIDLIKNVILVMHPKLYIKASKDLDKISVMNFDNMLSVYQNIRDESNIVFPERFVRCIFCMSPNLDAISDLQVYKCNDCNKVYCNTCDLTELPKENHKCTATLTRCPKCTVCIQKIGGCNHITCLCGNEFMYRNFAFVDKFEINIIDSTPQLNLLSNTTIFEIMMKLSLFDPSLNKLLNNYKQLKKAINKIN